MGENDIELTALCDASSTGTKTRSVRPLAAFGLPNRSSQGRAIRFLDDSLCAYPIGHGVAIGCAEQGKQVAFVPGTPGQMRVTAIAVKACAGSAS